MSGHTGSDGLFSALRVVRGYRRAFDLTEETEYVVAKVEVRIAVDPSRARTERDFNRGVEVMAERAVDEAANAYAWHSAQIDSVALVSVTRESGEGEVWEAEPCGAPQARRACESETPTKACWCRRG